MVTILAYVRLTSSMVENRNRMSGGRSSALWFQGSLVQIKTKHQIHQQCTKSRHEAPCPENLGILTGTVALEYQENEGISVVYASSLGEFSSHIPRRTPDSIFSVARSPVRKLYA